MRTLKELAKEALEVQDACNLLGVTKSFAKAVEEIYYLDCGGSMTKLADHPFITLWIDKLNDMTGRSNWMHTSMAFDYTYDIAKGQDHERI